MQNLHYFLFTMIKIKIYATTSRDFLALKVALSLIQLFPAQNSFISNVLIAENLFEMLVYLSL